MLGLADNAARAAPAVVRPIAEVAEHPCRLAGGHVPLPGLGALFGQRRFQAGIARQPEHVIDAVRLTPPHQRVRGEAAVAAQHDPHPRPLPANLRNDARHLRDSTLAAGDIGAPLPRQ